MKTNNLPLSYPIYLGTSPKLLELAKELRKNLTSAEKILWKKLNNKQLAEFKFRRQHPMLNYIVDFYCHSKKLVIEVDGGYHNNNYQKEYDIERSNELNNYGIKVIRFTNLQIEKEIEKVIAEIHKYLTQ